MLEREKRSSGALVIFTSWHGVAEIWPFCMVYPFNSHESVPLFNYEMLMIGGPRNCA